MPWCSSCGRITGEDAGVCTNCGARFASIGPSRLARKTVTVLFSDLTGFTALGEQLDPESVHEVMGRFFAEMGNVVERHGGMVEKFIGDEVMALFGVPVVHEDDALRAARTAVEMQSVLESLNEELASRWDVRLSSHTGLNTGEVAAGVRADGEPITYGDAVNVAKRLEAVASSGEILVGATTAQLLRGRARLTAVGPLQLRGKPDPVEAWRLHEVLAEAGSVRPARRARPLVDREAERRRLHEAFDAVVASRQPRTVTIVGPAGIGKSRLARALLDATASRATTVVGRCLPYGEGITYWPLTEIVRELAGRSDEAAIRELAAGSPDGARIAAHVARTVGFTAGGVPVEEAHWAVRRLLEIHAERRPLVVMVDDLHWAEPTLLDLIDHITAFARDAPLLCVLLTRPELIERRPAWGAEVARGTVLSLGPLEERDAAALVRGLAGADLGHGERDALLARAEGNPFFLEQMIAIRDEPGVATGPPATIQALLAARIDALPAAERAVVDRAAIEGRSFHRGAVARLLPPADRDALDASLDALERRELIAPAEGELEGEVGYRFAHSLVRDVAYELLVKSARAELHESYADWLEEQAGGGYGEIVGFHLEQACRCHAELHPGSGSQYRGLASRAGGYLGAAGHQAVARGDLPAGVNLLERAVALQSDDERARGVLVPELGMALVQLGRLAKADDVLTSAAADARADNDVVAEAQAVTVRFFARVQVSSEAAVTDLDARFGALRRVFVHAGDELGLARLWRAQALVHWLAGQSTQAEASWTRAVDHAHRAGDEQGRADAMCWLASAAREGPTPVMQAIPQCEAMLEQLQADRRSQALTMRPLASLHAMAGRLDRAHELFDWANAIFEELGVGLTSVVPHDEAFVALLSGNAAAAEAALRQGYELLDAMGERALLATTAAMLAEALYMQGNLDEAWEFAEVAHEAAADDDLSAQILGRTARAQVLARRGDAGAACDLSAEAVALASRTDWLNPHADTLMARAEVLRAAGDGEGAAREVRAALDLYERKGNVIAAGRARSALNDDVKEQARLKRPRAK
jgi:class 3 adenylate cyclase/tetratricopeptide (TPR) repeat protein